MLSHYGVIIGLTLVLIATGTSYAIITKAARSIEQFRHEDHALFERKHPGSGQ